MTGDCARCTIPVSVRVCGFFWEMWNAGSQARWIYSVPFVNRFHLFEMPLLGYAGYLPFGLECAVVAGFGATRAHAPAARRMRTHPSVSYPGLPRLLLAAIVVTALLLAAQAFPAAVRALFAAPSAWLSSQLLGVGMATAADGFRLACPRLPVDVTLACGGTTFFAMLLGLLLALPTVPPRRPCLLAVVALSYAITLAANTARIVLGWHAAVWSLAALPPSFHAGVHLGVGIVVFTGFLVAGVLAHALLSRCRHQLL